MNNNDFIPMFELNLNAAIKDQNDEMPAFNIEIQGGAKGQKGDTGEKGDPGVGIPGPQGPPGEPGQNGTNGQDGFSPIATVSKTDNGVEITITDANGTTTAEIEGGGSGGTSDYDELSNKPKINNVELSGNKTTSDLGLFSGDYDDLTNKPTIPDELADLSDDSTHRLVTDTEKDTWNNKATPSYVDTQIAALGTVFTLKGSVATASALPSQNNNVGDVYYVEDVSSGYVWIDDNNTERWEELGPTIDTSNFLTKLIGAYPTYYINKNEHNTANTAFDFSEKPAGLYIAYPKFFYETPYSEPQFYIKPRAAANAFSISGNDIVFIFIPTVLPETYVSNTNVYIIKISGKLGFYNTYIIDKGNEFGYSGSPSYSPFYYYVVGMSDNQTISGVKTFSALPKSSVTPTDNDHLVRKGYVDDKVLDVYSLTEVKTNKVWIDNKPIYRKVFEVSITQNNADTTISNSVISNLDTVTSVSGSLKNIYGNVFPLPNVNPNGTLVNGLGIFYHSIDGIRIRVGDSSLGTGAETIAIIEYTKTTD